MRTRLFSVLVLATSVFVGAGSAGAYDVQSCTLRPGCTVIDVPGSGPIPDPADAHGINDRSQIVGSFGGGRHGFLRTNGEYLTIDVPNADSTEAWGINNRTQIVGSYVVNGQSHGFLLENNQFTTVDPPGATSSSAYGINDLGQIVGTYTDAAGAHGFLWTHGRFNTLDIPVTPAGATEPRGINRIGQVVGFHTRPSNSGPSQSFRLGADGSVAALQDSPPGSPFFVGHFPYGINDRGEIVGRLIDPGGSHQFRVAFGQETIGQIGDTSTALGINNRGQIVGHFCSMVGECHGFLLTPANVVEDVSASASPDGSRVPVVTVIVDNALATWTLGPGEEILRNGVLAAGGYGSQILWHGGDIYVLGDDYNWWKWTGTTWSFAGPTDPTS